MGILDIQARSVFLPFFLLHSRFTRLHSDAQSHFRAAKWLFHVQPDRTIETPGIPLWSR